MYDQDLPYFASNQIVTREKEIKYKKDCKDWSDSVLNNKTITKGGRVPLSTTTPLYHCWGMNLLARSED